jgi:serine/threonine protein kinase
MPHANENDDTKILMAIPGEPGAPSTERAPAEPSFSDDSRSALPPGAQHGERTSKNDETPTMLRGDEVASSDSDRTENDAAGSQHTGLEGTRYEVVRAIGEGGMGTVYLANQIHPLKRQVAIKVVRKGPDIARFKKRFVNERQAIARLDHPHIAKFFESGQTLGGRPYYVMEYVPGVPITQFCDYHQLDLRQRLQLFIQVCDAVAHAHSKAIIHRDLKPSNVLAYMQDEKPMAKVIDFGLAKVEQLDDESLHHTKHGAIIGSSYYMSPEQSTGASDIDTRSDVYSLGVILYELLLGARPYDRMMFMNLNELDFLRMMSTTPAPTASSRLRGLSEEEQDRAARRRQVSLPQLSKILEKELEWIPLKAMRIEPERRYAGPGELAADIQRYLDGKALIAAPDSWRYVTSKWLVKNRSIVVAGVGSVFLLFSVAIGVSVLYFKGVGKQAEVSATLDATRDRKSVLEERLAGELAGRLALQRREKMKDPKWEPAFPNRNLLNEAPTQRIDADGAAVSRFHASHFQWKTDAVAAPFTKLSELTLWSINRARSNFNGFTVNLPADANKSADGEGNILIGETLNVLPYAECERTGETLRVIRIVLFVYCENEAQFEDLVAPTRSQLLQASTNDADAVSASSVVYSGPVRLEFRAPKGGYPWGTITVYPASASVPK